MPIKIVPNEMVQNKVERMAAVVAVAGLLTAVGLPAASQEVSKPTQAALASVITQQIAAFGRDDGAAAESFAVPAFKDKYPDPKDFVAMVHQSYAPLVHPRSTHFDETTETARGPLQKVTVVDSDGAVWTALYSFEQVDGQWRINGCALVKDKSTVI